MKNEKKNILKLSLVIIAAVALYSSAVFLQKKLAKENEENMFVKTEIPSSIPFFPDRTCNIEDFGAVRDERSSVNTKSINDAVFDCAKNGGGKVIIPKGKWLTGPIKLQSNIDLHLEEGAEVSFSTNFSDYLPVVFSRFEGIELYNYSPLIYAKDCENVAITGKGTLDGQGEAWWRWKREGLQDSGIKKLHKMAEEGLPTEERIFGNTDDALRPSFIQFVNCKKILLEDIEIKNGPMWTVHPIYSEDVLIKNISIETPEGVNTDGIVIDSSINILIEGCYINSGDDAIALKSGRDKDGLSINRPSENIIVRNCRIKEGHSGVAIGSEMSGGVKNVLIENCKIDRADFGFHIKSVRGRGGSVENILIRDIEINKIKNEIFRLDMQYNRTNNVSNENLPTFRDIHFKNISCQKADLAFFLRGLPEKPIESVSFENITAYAKQEMKKENIVDEIFKDISIKTEKK
ncbi:MAG TPA: glycoside hydrolase family 28 protein [Candidatus Moranbacteria bacterium]|nr:glycoside hydrolase family 28 protein [Candidatus Moranbacteria bacterium]HPX94622.1 glycoside hydrolase family 28 protein [Candidatus Moranbacteria bacterium]HQB59797.1 glycoside hydrolase family 28 protein [Candidatus Moranbacteria bacterium]